MIQSTTRHVKPCGKQGGPPPKAKYYLMTDSEIEPETVCLQPVKAPYEGDDVLFVERANELRYVARLST